MKRLTTTRFAAKKLLAGLSLTAVAAAVPQTASAQEAQAEDAPAGGLGEIIVTAQKKSESIQSVPISIAAVSGDQLAAMNVTTLQALQGAV
ncbi:MAG: TonB-dependent receptor, partial [Novosphingobium sp.]